MPYIKQEDRDAIDNGHKVPETPGELAYVIYTTVVDYYNSWEQLTDSKFNLMNEIVGVLANTKSEFQRNFVHPYEDEKILENGDVE